ncbi:prephenate dehydrogenase [Citricoccus nitrophenolicus]|uniref:Prephenate dehydrogenase n=1 Tax=Citricoccus muralis TaxID=169134 RepID=A0A3D9LB75_9MICC|nr:prephenate dehydrogenase [Citricoccus muralis]REE03402.1 prephenate dehydrogenase [Citricoccus muralis]
MAPRGIPEPVLIRGTGLLGTSIGLGLRSAGADTYLSDPSPSAQAVAVDIGAGQAFPGDLTAAPSPGVVVVAAPPDVAGQVVIDSLVRFPGAVVLDIASVKGAIRREVDAAVVGGTLTPAQAARYVGTHPMAGRERSGPVAARGALFTAAPWVVCAKGDTSPEAVSAAEEIARVLGATVHRMSAEDHDASVALISHLPQIAASLVSSRLQETPAQSLALSGNGLRDTTRIAASDPQLWVQILAANAPDILQILYGVREDLDRLITTMEEPLAPGARLDIAQLIAEGNAGHARIPGKHGAPPQAFAVVTVIVDDTPGQISAVLQDVGEAGVNVEDLRMDHSAGHEVGMLEISVLPGRKQDLTDALTAQGWKVV